MKTSGYYVDSEVLSYKHNMVNHIYIGKLCASKKLYSTGNKEDVILETCEEGETVCLFHPKGVDEEYFYFYLGVLDNLKIKILFSDFEAGLLTTLNIAPVQLRPNG